MIGRTTTIEGWRFVRASAEYIDVYPPGASTPVDTINVFDYERGEPSVPMDCRPARHRALGRGWLADNREWLADFAALA